VIPQLGHANKTGKTGPWRDAEVPHTHRYASQNSVQDAITPVAGAKETVGVTPSTFGEDDGVRRSPELFKERPDSFRPILSVGIHNDNGLAVHLLVNHAQAHGDRALVPHVATQAEHINGGNLLWLERNPAASPFRIAVVHEENSNAYLTEFAQFLINVLAKR
jgi:hypothetical protein